MQPSDIYKSQKAAKIHYLQVVGLIKTIFKVEEAAIVNLDVIYYGHSSLVYSFFLTSDLNQEYLLRFNLQKNLKNWTNEYFYLKLAKLDDQYLYFNVNDGTYIKKSLPGVTPQKFKTNTKFWQALVASLVELHALKATSHQIFSYSPYNFYLNTVPLSSEDQALFLLIGNLNPSLPAVLSHNSLDFDNILYNDGQVHLIDFEWVGWNNPYFDLACLFFSENIDVVWIKKIIKMYNKKSKYQLSEAVMHQFIYFAASLSYQWSLSQTAADGDLAILKYREVAVAAMQKYKRLFKLTKLLKLNKVT